ncbi:MAG: ribosome-associated translation inhibitor RaiA [Chlamydiota bacterium]
MVDKNKFKEEDAQGYRIDIIGRNLEITEPIRSYVWDKLSKIERFHNHIMYVHMTLEIAKLEHICIIVAKFDHFKVKVQASSSDMYATVDRAIDRLQTQLARYKSRIQDHHKKGLSVVDMQINVVERPFGEVEDINAEIEAANVRKQIEAYNAAKIIGKETKVLKTLTLDEAVMKMDLSGDQFLIFRSEEDQKLKVLYVRTDGNYGLIQPE